MGLNFVLKTLHILTSVVTVFIVSLYFIPDQEVTVKQDMPYEVFPAHDFVVELTIDKGNIDGFARLQQHLPDGFTAKPLFMGNAKFAFEDNYIKLVWFALPSEPSFTISYKVTVDNNVMPDQKTLTGIFSYIEK